MRYWSVLSILQYYSGRKHVYATEGFTMLLSRLVYMLAPSACLRCGAAGAEVCERCMDQVLQPKTPTCFRCNRLTRGFRTCRNCRRHTPLRRVWVAGYYEGIVTELISRMKYHNAIDNGRIGGQLLSAAIEGDWDLVVPVPSSPQRLRKRGFNPAYRIARSLARTQQRKCRSVLLRRDNRQQVGSDRKQRLTQVQSAFTLRSPRLVEEKRVLLVDDVITTGATLDACARCLHQGGARSVEAAVLARH